MDVPAQPIIDHYRQRVADLEYELVLTRIALEQKNDTIDELVVLAGRESEADQDQEDQRPPT